MQPIVCRQNGLQSGWLDSTCKALGPELNTSWHEIETDWLSELGGQEGETDPPIFADQLTLDQPGGHIMPTILLLAPPLGFSDLLTVLE